MSSVLETTSLNRDDLRRRLPNAALAFRGYNITNLGRTPELLEHPQYGPVMEAYLDEGSRICSRVIGKPVDLVRRVRRREETSLETYAEAIALIVAVEQAQLKLLEQFHDVDGHQARLAYGFSLGEIGALIYCGVFSMEDALFVPLTMAEDAVSLAHDVTMVVLFSRGEALPWDLVQRACMKVNQKGRGVIGISAQLSPNSYLILGTGETVDLLKDEIQAVRPRGVHLRKNENRWPPLHTPIVWNLNIPNRSSVLLHTAEGGVRTPKPPILSLVTGQVSYNDFNAREIIGRWIDHPQRLWDAVYETLAMGIETVIHVGPEPNIIPATFSRLATDVEAQVRGSRRMRALSAVIQRGWLQRLLPKHVALMRAPYLRQVVLEDWLLENPPASQRNDTEAMATPLPPRESRESATIESVPPTTTSPQEDRV